MKRLLTQWLIALLFLAPNVQAQQTQAIDIEQLYNKLSQAKSARVIVVPMPSCSFITENKVLIQALIDVLKKTNLKQIPENESFYYRSYQEEREGASSVRFMLDDGAVIRLGLGLEYTYEPTVDAMLFLPNQQQVPLSANWTMNRELFHWARKIGTPTVSLDEIRASHEAVGFRAAFGDNEARYRRQQESRMAGCKGEIRSNNYYRDPTIYQTCASGSDDVLFYQRHPDICNSGWIPRPKDVE